LPSTPPTSNGGSVLSPPARLRAALRRAPGLLATAFADQGELDLTSGRIGRPPFLLSLPIVVTNLLQVAYNLVDTFWLGQYSTEALAAITPEERLELATAVHRGQIRTGPSPTLLEGGRHTGHVGYRDEAWAVRVGVTDAFQRPTRPGWRSALG
jgi:hypothetical protein